MMSKRGFLQSTRLGGIILSSMTLPTFLLIFHPFQ